MDSRLVIPYDVEGVLVDLVKRRHPEHLAKAERQRGRRPETFERFATVVRMSDASAIRLSGDTVPACLLGVIGAPRFVRNEDDGVDATLQLGVQVTVMGTKRRDVLMRRDITAWTLIECLLERAPRDPSGLVSDVALVDYEPVSSASTQRTVGDARIVFEVGVAMMLAIRGGLPADDTMVAPGDPGGPPATPYAPPEPPHVADIQPPVITRTHVDVE